MHSLYLCLIGATVFFVVFAPRCYTQDLQFECFSCADAFDKCELDCSFNWQASNVTEVAQCQSDCMTTKLSCADNSATLKCTACMLICAESYDTEMRSCLSTVSRTTKMTYGSSLSECEIYASFDMDDCMSKCSNQNGLTEQIDDFS